jgi:hypothetical protein
MVELIVFFYCENCRSMAISLQSSERMPENG